MSAVSGKIHIEQPVKVKKASKKARKRVKRKR